MLQDEVSSFLRSTYKNDIFRYKENAFSNICEWVDKFQPDSIKFYERLLELIKNDENKEDNKKFARKDSANENGWYMSLSINSPKNIVVFFEKIYIVNTNPSKIEHYDIYEFKIIDKKSIYY
jgi:hypothetical protein